MSSTMRGFSRVDGCTGRGPMSPEKTPAASSTCWLRYRSGGASEIFNCGYSKGYSVHEVIAAVKRASGNDFKVVLSPRRAGDPAAIVAASAKIRNALGWQPQHDNLDEIVAQALNWERRVDQSKASTAG